MAAEQNGRPITDSRSALQNRQQSFPTKPNADDVPEKTVVFRNYRFQRRERPNKLTGFLATLNPVVPKNNRISTLDERAHAGALTGKLGQPTLIRAREEIGRREN